MEEAIVVKLPPMVFVLPREKHVPKPRPLTKWQEFAKEKGITKKKKSKLTWDEELKVIFTEIFKFNFLNKILFYRNGYRSMVSNEQRQKRTNSG